MSIPIYESKYSNSWALVIGINKYKHASPLSFAKNDAEAVAEILVSRFKFPKSNILVLLDDKATMTAIKKGFMSFADKKIQPNDRILVFFAGHGHTASGKRGEVGFLVPSDGRIDDLTSLMRWDELTRNADFIAAKHIFFLMDACYGGLALTRRPSFGSMRFLGDMLQRYARQVLTAGKADETVADGNGVRPGHSIFTAHLLDALEGKASTKEGIITASGVMAYVYDQVAQDQYSQQTPHYGFVEGDGDFIFDTSPLDALRAESIDSGSGDKGGGDKGAADILINPSPEIPPELNEEAPIANAMKELLADSSKRIRLDDFVSFHIRKFLANTDLRHFPVQDSNVQNENIIERVKTYEEISKDLQQIMILLAKWGKGEQLQQIEKIFSRLAEADKGSAGLVLWLNLTWYPIMYLMYSVGIASIASRNYEALRLVFETQAQVDPRYNKTHLPIIVPTVDSVSRSGEVFKLLSGNERHYAPRSEYLFKALQPTLEDTLFLGRSYESLFDKFEIIQGLVYSDVTERNWGPIGRFGWKHDRGFGESPFTQLVEEAKKSRDEWGPIKAGLFQGSFDRFMKDSETFKEVLGKLNWW